MSKDLDINNYSIEDLFAFFKIDEPINKTRIDYQINNTIRTFLEKFNNDYENEYIQFFYKCKDKIHKHLETLDIDIDKTIEEEKKKAVINIYNDKYPVGVINPIEKKYVKKIVNIDTMFRDNYIHQSATNFTFNMPDPIKNVVKMKLSAIEIPHSWYLLNQKNNFFYIDKCKIEIKPGNYNSNTFSKAFKEAINSSECKVFDDDNPITVDPITGKTIMNFKVCKKKVNVEFQYISSNNYNNSLGWILGYKKLNYVIRCETKPFNLESESVFGSGVGKYIFLEVNDYNNNSKQGISSFTNKNQLSNNILARITISSGHNTLIMDNGSDLIFKEREYFGPVTIDKLHIKLINHFGEEIDLNNNDYSFALEFTELYS